MSNLAYNGIVLQLVKTNSFERIANWSDDKTEYKWTDFIIDVNCIYNPAATSYNSDGSQGFGNLPMTTDTAIRHTLMQPREQLTYEEGGITILDTDGDSDCDNGPIPQTVTVTRIGSSRIFFVDYVIKASIIECPSGSFPSAIASSRYGRMEDIDEDFISTLTTTGITYFRNNVLAELGNSADFYRAYILPPQLLGYKRTRISFALDSNGNTCKWSTTDVEQKQELGDRSSPGTAASVGITKMGMTYHTESLRNSSMGLASFGSTAIVNTWATTSRFVDRYNALSFIIACAFQKASILLNLGLVVGGGITEDVFSNRVEANMVFKILDDASGFPDMRFPIQGIVGNSATVLINGLLPNNTGLNPWPNNSKGTRGTAAYILAVSSFFTACTEYSPEDSTATVIDPEATVPPQVSGQGPAVTAYYDPGDPVPDSPLNPPIRQKAKEEIRCIGDPNQIIYDQYPIRSNFNTESGIIQIPVACSVQSILDQGQQNNPPSCVNIQLFQPVSKKVVEWSQTRIGAVPEVPDPTVPDYFSNNYTLLSSTLSPCAIEVIADGGTPIYRISGVYTYSLLNAVQSTDNIGFDIPPWLNLQASEFTQLIPSDFEQGIINQNVQGQNYNPNP